MATKQEIVGRPATPSSPASALPAAPIVNGLRQEVVGGPQGRLSTPDARPKGAIYNRYTGRVPTRR